LQKTCDTNTAYQYDIVLAVSELVDGTLDLTLSYWDSVVDEHDAQRALRCLELVLGMMGCEEHLKYADVVEAVAV
jgi:hypothetical protein